MHEGFDLLHVESIQVALAGLVVTDDNTNIVYLALTYPAGS